MMKKKTAFSAAGRRHVCRAADRLRRQFQRPGERRAGLRCSASADASTSADSSAAGDAAASQEGGADSAELNLVEDGKLIMSTNAQFPPYEMVAGDGSFEGIDVEVAQAIAEKLNLELVIDDMDFDAALLAVQNGRSDIVMAGVTVNEERSAVMDFSDSYANACRWSSSRRDSEIASIDDLEGKQIGLPAGHHRLHLLLRHPGERRLW